MRGRGCEGRGGRGCEGRGCEGDGQRRSGRPEHTDAAVDVADEEVAAAHLYDSGTPFTTRTSTVMVCGPPLDLVLCAHSAKQSAQRLGWAGVCTWRSRGKVRGKSRACLHGSPHVVEYSTAMTLRGSRCYAQTCCARLAHLSSWRSGRKARGARVPRCVGNWVSRWRARQAAGQLQGGVPAPLAGP